MELIGDVKTYEWGKLGLDSEVAKLAQLNSVKFTAVEGTPYSEFWMGDHPSGPSLLKDTSQELGAFIAENADSANGSMKSLPFLFKVLSIRKALSVQVHPNKEEAERLHAEHPDIYKDANHKPELAIALTTFRALCGFRPLAEIQELCKKFEPLMQLIGPEIIENLESNTPESLKLCYSKLMTSAQDDITKCIETIRDDAKHQEELEACGLKDIFATLYKDFPNDVGILSIFFLNVINLKPGQAIFLAAKEPHAYLEGDCLECMACSDNVIRAGLTPKFKDIHTLIETLNYNGEPAEKKLFQSAKIDDLELFVPPVKDFSVGKIHIPITNTFYQMRHSKYASILLVLDGEAIIKTSTYGEISVRRGSVIFIPGDSGCYLEFYRKSEADNFTAYMAMYNFF